MRARAATGPGSFPAKILLDTFLPVILIVLISWLTGALGDCGMRFLREQAWLRAWSPGARGTALPSHQLPFLSGPCGTSQVYKGPENSTQWARQLCLLPSEILLTSLSQPPANPGPVLGCLCLDWIRETQLSYGYIEVGSPDEGQELFGGYSDSWVFAGRMGWGANDCPSMCVLK